MLPLKVVDQDWVSHPLWLQVCCRIIIIISSLNRLPRLQELFLQLSFCIAHSDDQSPLPDIIGIVTHATSSPAAIQARKEIAELGEFVSNSARSAPAFERGIIAYTRNVCELDVRFLEQTREEICNGYDAFMRVAEIIREYPTKDKQVRVHLALILVF